ncbi:serine acetyltransferase [Sphingobium nicotianae]|uniref:Serine acetyltransferase n=1 Tax=Sphingobium nicotianae TaxID=2782607 RepID=A0A9X1D9D5_9SPHN|nr:serine acetyltransferase [Sphingobium nicotianae]MBT2185688.1 serine acetyltransferase [Sphingobium nicotianae]
MTAASPDSDRAISAEVPDWNREAKGAFEWAPSRALLASIRAYQRHRAGRGPVAALGRVFATLRHRFWSVVTGADIPVTCRIGGGLLMPHPNGIVVHPEAVIGPNCLFMQQVTIGMRAGKVPVIGGHVDIGAGAAILGLVTIGNHARIGAHALVIHDMPEGAVAMAPLAQIKSDSQAE